MKNVLLHNKNPVGRINLDKFLEKNFEASQSLDKQP